MGRPAGGTTKRRNLDWQREAACDNTPAFLAEPEDGGWNDSQRKRLCNGHSIGDLVVDPPCPVRQQCLEYAQSLPLSDIAHNGLVFGGYTGKQIARKIRDNRRDVR